MEEYNCKTPILTVKKDISDNEDQVYLTFVKINCLLNLTTVQINSILQPILDLLMNKLKDVLKIRLKSKLKSKLINQELLYNSDGFLLKNDGQNYYN